MNPVPLRAQSVVSGFDSTALIRLAGQVMGGVAKVGFDEAGSRVLGQNAWSALKSVFQPVYEECVRRFPALKSLNTPEADAAGVAAVRALESDVKLQGMLLERFNRLEARDQLVLTMLSHIEADIKGVARREVSIEDMVRMMIEHQDQVDKRIDQVLVELRTQREQPNKPRETTASSASTSPSSTSPSAADPLNELDQRLEESKNHLSDVLAGAQQRRSSTPQSVAAQEPVVVEQASLQKATSSMKSEPDPLREVANEIANKIITGPAIVLSDVTAFEESVAASHAALLYRILRGYLTDDGGARIQETSYLGEASAAFEENGRSCRDVLVSIYFDDDKMWHDTFKDRLCVVDGAWRRP